MTYADTRPRPLAHRRSAVSRGPTARGGNQSTKDRKLSVGNDRNIDFSASSGVPSGRSRRRQFGMNARATVIGDMNLVKAQGLVESGRFGHV